MGAVVVLSEDVAVVVVGGAGATAATALRVVAGAARAGVRLRAQLLEHGARRPDFIEGSLAHVARLLGHVGAGTHDALAADDAVREAGQAAPLEARVHAQLLRHARELGSARGLHVDGHLRGLRHDVLEQLLVLQHLERCLLDELAAPHGDEEEHVVRHSADLHGEVGDVAHLVAVPIHDGGVQLERQARLLAGLDARHGEVVGMLEPAEPVVLDGIEAVHRDAHGAGSGLLQPHGDLRRDERAVRAEHGAQPARGGVRHQLVDIGAHERLAAREDHHLEAGAGDLVDHLLALLAGELFVSGLLGVLVAMDALEVALVRRHPRHEHRRILSWLRLRLLAAPCLLKPNEGMTCRAGAAKGGRRDEVLRHPHGAEIAAYSAGSGRER